jgi:metal-sulfur cluster biosynthetic enzyme
MERIMMNEQVLEALHDVVDPEIGVNVVDLGLVYNVDVQGNSVRIAMTMTTPACPLHEYISETAKTAVRRRLPEIERVDVDIVWDPPWSPAMMSPEAKRQLGWGS